MLTMYKVCLYKQSDMQGKLKLVLPHLQRKLGILSTSPDDAVWVARILYLNEEWGAGETVFATARNPKGQIEEYALFYSDVEHMADRLGITINPRRIRPRNVWK